MTETAEAIRPREPVAIKKLLEERYQRHVWLRRITPRISKALQAFPETHPDHWHNYVETMRRMGSTKAYLMEELALEKEDPLYAWMVKSAMPDDDHVIVVDNRFWDNIGPIYPAIELQRRVWKMRLGAYGLELPRLADEIEALELELVDAKPLEYAAEDKRTALRRIKFRIERQQALVRRLEAEILAEENRANPGPMRAKHGFSNND